jgi:hypothetical protein
MGGISDDALAQVSEFPLSFLQNDHSQPFRPYASIADFADFALWEFRKIARKSSPRQRPAESMQQCGRRPGLAT